MERAKLGCRPLAVPTPTGGWPWLARRLARRSKESGGIPKLLRVVDGIAVSLGHPQPQHIEELGAGSDVSERVGSAEKSPVARDLAGDRTLGQKGDREKRNRAGLGNHADDPCPLG